MWRKSCEVTDPEKIQDILSKANIGRLATIDANGFPYITPVNFVFHKGKIYFHCAPRGEKLDNMANHPKVCFEVDIPLAYMDAAFSEDGSPCRIQQFYHCVILRGYARIVDEDSKKIEALNALVEKHEPGKNIQAVHTDMAAYRACSVVEITPERMSAKSDLAQGEPAEVRSAIIQYLKERGRPGDLKTVEAFGLAAKPT